MKLYSSYKDSGVEWIGEIPNDWSLKKVKYLFSTEKNQISVKEFEDNEVIHYSIPNVQEFGKGQLENGNDIDSSKLLLNGNELLVSRLNPRKKTVCISEPDNEHMILGSGEFIVLVPNGINLEYCYYQFVTGGMTQNLDSLVESVTKSHQRVRPERVFNTLYIKPPKDEIERIVSFLDTKTQKIDELIEKTEQKIELLKGKRTSLINHCVTKGLNPNVEMKDSGVEWIGEIPSHWEVKPIKYISDYNQDSLGSDTPSEYELDYLEISDVNSVGEIGKPTHYTFSKSPSRCRRILNKNDIIISTVRTYLRSIGFIENEVQNLICSTGFCVLTPKNMIEPKLLFYLVRSEWFISKVISKSVGVSYPGIQTEKLMSIKVLLPPISEQTQIVEYLDEQTQKIDSTIEKETQRTELLKEYRQSLISEVVTGKVDVRDWKE